MYIYIYIYIYNYIHVKWSSKLSFVVNSSFQRVQSSISAVYAVAFTTQISMSPHQVHCKLDNAI